RGGSTGTLPVADSKGWTAPPAPPTATIANLPPAVTAGPDQSVLAGTALSVRATFNDPGPTDYPWSYSFAWGDGATDVGSTNIQGLITGSHVYAAPGRYTVRFTVSDKYGAAGSGQFLVKVL